MRLLSRTIVLALVLAIPLPSMAVEVRRIESTTHYAADMVRAYAPCTAPNTVTSHGQPACAPALTSACKFRSASIQISDFSSITLAVQRLLVQNTPLCKDGEYRLALTYRGTFPNDLDATCASAICTTVDTTELSLPFTLNNGTTALVPGIAGFRGDGNFQILGAQLIAPDGLPMAAAAIGGSPTGQFQNLSIGYAPCASPLPGYQACDTQPWDSPCDFTTGTIAYHSIGVPSIFVSVHQLSGASPLCANGTYQLETRARLTVEDCGPAGDEPCTLPDAAYVSSLPANGFDLTAPTGFAGLNNSLITAAELLGFRLFDPTGGELAAAAITLASPLTQTRVTVKGDQLRVRALFPADLNAIFAIDPTNDEGATFTLHDRTGVIHTVNIPGPTWQLQPPLGERWEYKDPGGTRAGVKKIRIRLKRKRGVPVGYDVQLAADGVDLSAADLGAVTLTIASAIRDNEFTAVPRTAQTTRACKLKGKKKSCE
jgi:hypothetical protein